MALYTFYYIFLFGNYMLHRFVRSLGEEVKLKQNGAILQYCIIQALYYDILCILKHMFL